MKTSTIVSIIVIGVIVYVLYTSKSTPAKPVATANPKSQSNPATAQTHAQQVAVIQGYINDALALLSYDDQNALASDDTEKEAMVSAGALLNGFNPINFSTSEFDWVTQ